MSPPRICGLQAYCNALRVSGRYVVPCPHCAENQKRDPEAMRAFMAGCVELAERADVARRPRYEIYWHHADSPRPTGQVSAADLETAHALAAEHAFEGGTIGFAIVFDCERNRLIAAYEGAERIG